MFFHRHFGSTVLNFFKVCFTHFLIFITLEKNLFLQKKCQKISLFANKMATTFFITFLKILIPDSESEIQEP